MRYRFFISGLFLPLLILALAFSAFAQDMDPDALAKESEDAAAASAKDKPTPKIIIDKVQEGCKLLQAEGLGAIRKFQGKDSQFIFNGTYIWIHDMDGNMIMHPIKHKMNGKPLLSMKDSVGKLFFSEMNQVVGEKGSGWVSYMWPKPGEKAASEKVSYVLLCPVEDKQLVLGCGVYDITPEDIEKAMK